jgi:hypothetical protein
MFKNFIPVIIGILFFSYTSIKGEVWQREAPDTSGTDKGRYCSIAVDGDNNPHIAYYDDDFNDLRYAYYHDGDWTIEIVDSIGDVGIYCSIALDSYNRPHISYQQEYLDYYWSLKYATRTDTGWSKIIVETPKDKDIGEIGEYSSIAINSNDYPCISYLQDNPTRIKYAYKDASRWHIMDVNDVYSPYYNKLRLVDGEIPVIGYHRYESSDLYPDKLEVACFNPSTSIWDIIVLPDTVDRVNFGSTIGFDIDNQGNIYFAYCDQNYDLQLAVYDGQSWIIEPISIEHVWYDLDLKIDNAGDPCLLISEFDGPFFHKIINGELESTLIDDSIVPSGYLSLDFDSNNHPRIAMFARTLNYTRYGLFYYRYWPGDPQIILPEISHNFGAVWTQSYADWDCPVNNQGDAPLIIKDLEYSSTAYWDTAFQVVSTPLPKTILPQESGLITLRFKPPGDETFQDTLNIFSNDPLNSVKRVSVQGTGTSSGTGGDLQLTIKNIYIDHQYQLLKNDLPLSGASVSLYQNSQLIFGPSQTGTNGQVSFNDVAVGTYDLEITDDISIPDNASGSSLDNLRLTTALEIGPGSNTKTILFPESLMIEKYEHIYNLTHIERTSWNYSKTYHYPGEQDVKDLLEQWETNLPPELQENMGRLIITENMIYRMFDGGYSIGKEFMRDTGELMNLVLYSENWGTSISEILLDILIGVFTGDWAELIFDIIKEVLQEFLQDMLMDLITEGVDQISAELGDPGKTIINTSWKVIKNSYSSWSLGDFTESVWNKMAGEIYRELRNAFFQEIYIELLTDNKINKARVYSNEFQYNGEFNEAYYNSNYYIAHELGDIENKENICSNLRTTAHLFKTTASILDLLGILPIPGIGLLHSISVAMKITAYVEVLTAMGISGYTFFAIPDYMNDAVDNIYFPEGKPSSFFAGSSSFLFPKAKIRQQTLAMLKKNVQQSTSEYDSILSEIKNEINSGNQENAILALDDLMHAENNLRNSFRTSLCPIYSVANEAKNSLESFEATYDTLKIDYARAGESRLKNYLYVLFSPTDTSQAMKDSITAHLDRCSNKNYVLTDQIAATLDTVSVLPMPAIVIANQSSQDIYRLEPGKPATVQVQIQNIGPLTADDVSIILHTNPAIRVVEEDSIYIGTLNPGAKSNIFSWTVALFSAGYSRGIWTLEIQSSNAKTYSSSGSFRIQQGGPGTGGKLTNENIYNYPNPFNPAKEITTLRYSLEKTANVTIKIYDAGGNLVLSLLKDMQQLATDEQSVPWDGKNGKGDIVANGVYFYVIETSEDERAVGKIAVLR